MQEDIFARGKLFELVHQTQPGGRVFEIARRAPGVRLIIPNRTDQLLLTRELRRELGGYDFRLPGGKVFDTLEEFDAWRQSGRDIADAAESKAREECLEETGLEAKKLSFFHKSTLGATVEWDLYVFEVTEWSEASGGQQLEHGEDIETAWYGYSEVEQMIMNGDMQEERIALLLLRWLNQKR